MSTMTYTTDERQRVYTTCRAIFSGNAALLRRPKTVRKELVKNRKGALANLFQAFGEVKLTEIARQLLESRIFESDLRAKVEFPDLFRTSPLQDAQREASEADAAKSLAGVLGELARDEDGEGNVADADDPDWIPEPVQEKLGAITQGPPVKSSTASGIPSLYPSYVPYSAQHSILTAAQRVLEESCFDFATKWFPELVQEKGWECASAVELTKWIKVFKQKLPKLPLHATAPPAGCSVEAALLAVHPLRHTAVHRVSTTAREISSMLHSALRLAKTLRDVPRAALLEELASEVDNKIKAMDLSKNVLENRATAQMEEIRLQREALDREEKRLLEGMVQQDREQKALIGRLLESSVREILDEGMITSQREESDSAEAKDEADVDDPGCNGVNGVTKDKGYLEEAKNALDFGFPLTWPQS
ncbi:ubiquinol-cytochrome-c reductase cytochrome c1 [Colletotrichum musicola]|uniref:Ubiquinol-cytochrome-c reductase cytochrome c1 n=1 Tax=Colletotrichum musicola TaxID=2175873 RepID=A0A8H6NG41_9PEZI|nr:ubiquinol-cytochrome-c reductase cytochrome c1 [Colletotrichum musicola]